MRWVIGSKTQVVAQPFQQSTQNQFSWQAMPGTDPNQVVSDYQNYNIDLDPGASQRAALRSQATDNKWNSAYAAGIPTHLRMALQGADQRANQQLSDYDRQNAEYGKSGMELARKQSLLPQLTQSGSNSSGYNSQIIQKPSIWGQVLQGAATVGGAMLSDERLKDIKGENDAGLDEVKRLKPITYKYKDETGLDNETHHGLGAGETEKVIPSAIAKMHAEPDEDDAYKSVLTDQRKADMEDADADDSIPANPKMINYETITSALVNSAQEIDKRLRALEGRR